MHVGVHLPQRERGFGADLGAIREYVQAAESLAYDHLRCGDHVLGANAASRPDWWGPYDYTYLWHEPLVLFGYLAAITRTLELVTAVLILPQRQAVLVAKQASAVDVLSGGRLRLGIGLGWSEVEYEGLGEDFRNRGRRCEEQIEVMRALWTNELVTFDGRWHKINDAGLNPLPVRRPIPIWIGGGPGSTGSKSDEASDRVLRRIARMADGWFPALQPESGVGPVVARLHQYIREEGRDPSDVGIEGSVSIAGQDPEDWVRRTLEWNELGATHVTVSTIGAGFSSVDQHVDALRRYKEAAAGVSG